MAQANRGNIVTHEESQLAEIVARIIDIRRTHVRIVPSWIATEALKEIDPANRSHPLVRAGCHLQLRQIARAQCRNLFEDGDTIDDGEPEFTGFKELQWRYPAAHSKGKPEPEYVLLDQLSRADVIYNVRRLRREGQAKLKHADALEAWDLARRGAA
jgi:hypothetical protein